MGRASDLTAPADRRGRRWWRHRRVVTAVSSAVVLSLGVVGLGACAPACTTVDCITLSIVNRSGTPDDQVYVMLTGNGVVSATPAGLVNTSVALSKLTPVAGTEHAYSFIVNRGISAGLVWLSFGAPVSNAPRPDVNTSPTRFANVELAFPGQADLTNVDQFSVPMQLATIGADGAVLDSTGYATNTDCIVDAFRRAITRSGGNPDAAVKTSNGRFLRVVSPSHDASAWPSMAPYLAAMKGQTITVAGHFGNDQFPAESGSYRYTGRFDPVTGALALTGTIGGTNPDGSGGRAGQPVTASESDLASAVYSQAGSYAVPGDPVAVRPPSPNDVYGSIYRDLIAAFAWGFWGGTYGNDNRAFTGRTPFAAARPAGEPFPGYSIYSDVLWHVTDAYSMPYAESYGSGGHPSPLLDIPAGTAELRTTILPDATPGGCPATP